MLNRNLNLLAFAMLMAIGSRSVQAESPSTSYIFPAGGQRGTTVQVRVGGHYLHDGAAFRLMGAGVSDSERIERTETVWFEGPVIPMPASQRSEDYPVDYAGTIQIDSDAGLGLRSWYVRNPQGTTEPRMFVVGSLPEVVETEIDGKPIAQHVTLPVTVNGRVFPREDVDIWSFDLEAGQTVTCVVNAARIGSPLDARITIRDPEHRRVTADSGTFGDDPFVRFTSALSGRYILYLNDTRFGGLQNYVYRLTITDGPFVDSVFPLGGKPGQRLKVRLNGVNLPQEYAEIQLPDQPGSVYRWQPEHASISAQGIPLQISAARRMSEIEAVHADDPLDVSGESGPLVIDGRITAVDEIDAYQFAAVKGHPLTLKIDASQLGSPLDAVLSIFAADGRKLIEADDSWGHLDPAIEFKPPADGLYTVQVRERFGNRVDETFAYRLHISGQASADTAAPFSVSLPASTVNVDRGGEMKLKVPVDRQAFPDPIELSLSPLPAGVTLAGTTIGKNKKQANLVISVSPEAAFGLYECRLVATAETSTGTYTTTARATDSVGGSGSNVDSQDDVLRLSVNVPTPFKFSGIFESKFVPRGSVYRRHYTIDRGGYEGPLTVRLADRQVRHLQGVTGPEIVVPAGVNEFDYPAKLPPWLEVGRTSRTCLMAIGQITLDDGSTALVTYTSQAQNDQIIVLTAPEQFSVQTDRSSYLIKRGQPLQLDVRIGRSAGLDQAVQVELDCPDHIQGLAAQPITINADTGQLTVVPGTSELGPFNMPVKIKATTHDERGDEVTAECEVEFVIHEPLDTAGDAVQTGRTDQTDRTDGAGLTAGVLPTEPENRRSDGNTQRD